MSASPLRWSNWHHFGRRGDSIVPLRLPLQGHPARFVLLAGLHRSPSVAERLSRFLDSEAEFKSEYGLYSVDDRPRHARRMGVCGRGSSASSQVQQAGRHTARVPAERQLAHLPSLPVGLSERRRPAAVLRGVTGIDLAASADFGSHCRAGRRLPQVARRQQPEPGARAGAVVSSPAWKPDTAEALKIFRRRRGTSPRSTRSTTRSWPSTPGRGQRDRVVPISEAAGTRKRLTIGGWYHSPD